MSTLNYRNEGDKLCAEYEGLKITIEQDTDPENCRTEWDNLGTMVCWHRRYDLGDKHSYEIEEVQEMIKRDDILWLPLYLYDHSGISMSTGRGYPFDCPWDSGQVGYVFLTLEKVKEEYGNVSDESKKKALAVLKSEVETYDQYLRGDVFGYTIEGAKGEIDDSCWGFYGIDHCKEEAESTAKWHAEDMKKQQLAAWGGAGGHGTLCKA